MKCLALMTVLVFASKNENDIESAAALKKNIMQNAEANLILVKIEETEYVKAKSSKFIGVSRNCEKSKWSVYRWSKMDHRSVHNGNYKDEETAAHASDTLARELMANGEQSHKLNFPHYNTEVHPEEKKTSSKYIGLSYNDGKSKWGVRRWSKYEKKIHKNGYHTDEEAAAHASDTLARELMANGENGHKLNFPDDNTKVHAQAKRTSSKYIGVDYSEKHKKWFAHRWSRNQKKIFYSGYHKDEERAARASDAIARKLMDSERDHDLNFPNKECCLWNADAKKGSDYFGVFYNEVTERYCATRWSTGEKRSLANGTFKNEEKAARASDTLARHLMANGEYHKMNFQDDDTEVYRKRVKHSKYIGVTYNEIFKNWLAQRWSKNEKKRFGNGIYKDEKTAAHASDTLARKLIANGEKNHKLNFPDESNEEITEYQTNKRKRRFDLGYSRADRDNLEK